MNHWHYREGPYGEVAQLIVHNHGTGEAEHTHDGYGPNWKYSATNPDEKPAEESTKWAVY